MMQSLLKNNLAYLIGGLANGLAQFLLLPYLLNRLSPSANGQWGLFEIVIQLLIMAALLGLDVGLMREYWLCQSEADRQRVVGTVLRASLLWCGCVLLLGAAGITLIATVPALQTSVRVDVTWPALTLVLLIALTDALFTLLLSVLRIREQAALFATLQTLRMVLLVGLAIVGVELTGNVTGALAGRWLASVIGGVAAAWVLRGAIVWRWERAVLGRVLRYSLPLLPTNFAGYILLASDRFILNAVTSVATLAIYNTAYKLATTLDIVVTRPFQLDWAPRRFKIATRPDAGQMYGKALLFYLWASLSFGLLILAGVDAVYALFVPAFYHAGKAVLPVILLAFLLYGLSYPLNVGILLKERTALLPPLSAVSAVVCILLNLWWIPPFGMMGAAWATVVAYLTFTALLTIASQRLYPIRYPLGRIGQVVAAAGVTVLGLYGLGWLYPEANLWLATSAKAGWVALVMGSSAVLIFRIPLTALRRPLRLGGRP